MKLEDNFIFSLSFLNVFKDVAFQNFTIVYRTTSGNFLLGLNALAFV